MVLAPSEMNANIYMKEIMYIVLLLIFSTSSTAPVHDFLALISRWTTESHPFTTPDASPIESGNDYCPVDVSDTSPERYYQRGGIYRDCKCPAERDHNCVA